MKSDQQSDNKEGATALIPKTLLGGKKFNVGDEVVLEIVHEYEDEVEVKYASEKPDKKPSTPETPASADEEIDMMAGKPGPMAGY